MTYPTCPRCRKGKLVPMLMSGPACDLACERESAMPSETAITEDIDSECLMVGSNVMLRRFTAFTGVVLRIQQDLDLTWLFKVAWHGVGTSWHPRGELVKTV